MKNFILLFCILVLCAASSFAGAEDRPRAGAKPAPGERAPLELTLAGAVETALRQNLTAEEAALLSEIASADLKRAEGEFDPALSMGIRDAFEKTGTATLLSGPESEAFGADVALGGKIHSGTGYELKLSAERVEMSETPFLLTNPYYTSRLMFTVNQPLLKGFGRRIQKSRISSAKYGVDAARLRAESRALDIADRTVRAYWDIYLAKHGLDVAGLSLKLAENILKEVTAKIAAGELAQVDIYSAEAEVAIRTERLLMAEKAVHDAADALRVVLNLQDWQSEISAVDAPGEPSGRGPSDIKPLDELLQAAWENRRDLQMALMELEGLKVMTAYYKNQRLPELNIQAGAGLNGLGDGYGDAFDEASSGDFYSWQAGLTLNVPLRGRTSSGSYLRAKNEEEMALLKIQAIKQAINAEVRESYRAVALARESTNATLKTRVAAQKRLEAEEARFKVGMATVNDVLRYQKDFTDALVSEKRALTDYEKALSALRKATFSDEGL